MAARSSTDEAKQTSGRALLLMGAALLVFLVALHRASARGVFGAEAGEIVKDIVWALGGVSALLTLLDLNKALQKSAKSFLLRIASKPAWRYGIIGGCSILAAGLIVRACSIEPAPPPLVWTCEIRTNTIAPREDIRCPADPPFDRMQSLRLRLRRDGAPAQRPHLLAITSDRNKRSVTLNWTKSGSCTSPGPDSPFKGQSQLELKPECRDAGAYEVFLDFCYAQQTEVVDVANLAPVVDLKLLEGETTHELRCEDGPGPVVISNDAGVDASDAGLDARGGCPSWNEPAGTENAWLFAWVYSSDGRPLTVSDSDLDVDVTSLDPAGPRRDTKPNDPCAVLNYRSGTTDVKIAATAPGYIPQDRNFNPASCTQLDPCDLVLPRNPGLPARYFAPTSAKHDRLLGASELPPDVSLDKYAADVAQDAVVRSRKSKRPLETELEITAKASGVPMSDLLTKFADNKLRRTCDAACADDSLLDEEVRVLLIRLRREGKDPFDRRTSPGTWRRPDRVPRERER